ncbi:hypothetical protein HT136_13600 [Novosphingobium profundi]|uniref:hypothetical protein n=1 Tax=Novosphingobium profundi TaxID=1774954 RepID=UPI001BD9B113|nr:hypothetical protein [Novosphingobium profundi]MBT0669401.1 hypothetical protein [Novosphingobium profundi]
MRGPSSPERRWRARERSALYAALGGAFLVFALLAIAHRGPWYDELYTYYMTRPGQPFGALWAGWLRDNHPPTYYFLAWLANLFGPALVAHRLINLVIAGAALSVLWALARVCTALRPLLFAYLVACASYPSAVMQVAELRSNFLAYASAALAVAALVGLATPESRRGRGRAAVLCTVLAFAFCVHLAETVIVAGVCAAFGLRLLLERALPQAARLAVIGALAAVPFVLCMAVQLATIAGNTQVFWIAGGLSAARWAIELEVLANLAANPALTLAGLVGLAFLVAGDFRRRRVSEPLRLVLTLAGGLALAVAMLVVIHLQRPFIIDRYLVGLHPPIGMIMAIGSASALERLGKGGRTLLCVALVAGAIWAMAAAERLVEARTSWDGTGAAIGELVRACPTTRVYSDTAWNRVTLDLPPRDNRAVIPFAYRWVAQRHGFALTDARSRDLSPACPTVFWTEHVAGQSPSAGAIIASLRARGFAIGTADLRRIGDGWLLVVAPDG